jgi:GT2 family glycosyltransferase
MKPKIAIVILNWNGYADTSECIISLQKITYDNYQIVVVDNGSVKEDYLLLKKNFPEIEVIKSESNLGFTGGNNLGIQYAMKMNPDYLLLINNDTIVEPNFIQPLLNVFEEDKNAGIAAPQINYFYDPQKIWTAGGKISRLRGSGFAYSDRIESWIKPDNKSVTFVSGCCMLIKKEVFEKIGLFDENFFLYVEDADLCFRTTHAGYKIIVNHHSKILHKVSYSTKENLSYLPLYYVTRNRLYFAKKNFHNIYFITFIYILTSMIYKSFKWIFVGEIKNVQMVKNAFKDFLLGFMGKTNHNIFKSK